MKDIPQPIRNEISNLKIPPVPPPRKKTKNKQTMEQNKQWNQKKK